jgi:16S rRNA (cytosine967-C5)-methyltransferase
LKTETGTLAEKLRRLGFSAELDSERKDILFLEWPGGEKPLDTELYKEGYFSVQDKASVIAAASVGAERGETIVDVCSAPGGKAMAMAEAMGNKGRIIALDIHKNRIELIKSEASRLGVDIVETMNHDSCETVHELEGRADRVLADVPCSGLGVARRKPEVKYKEFDESMQGLPQLQLDILKASAGYLKPGGTLVYSTCTIAKRENEDVISSFLQEHDSFEKQDEMQMLPTDGDTDGFYICKLIRSGYAE